MSLYAFIIVVAIIMYIEVTRRRNNKKVTNEIKKVKRDVKYQLEMLNAMFGDDKNDELVEPKTCRTEITKNARRLNETISTQDSRKEGYR